MFLVRRFTLICMLAGLFGAGIAKLATNSEPGGLSARADARALCVQARTPGCRNAFSN